MIHLLADTVTIPLPVQLGIAGTIIVGFITGQIVPGFVAKRESQRGNLSEKRERELYDKIIDRAIPAFEATANLERELVRLMPQVLEELKAERDARKQAEEQLLFNQEVARRVAEQQRIAKSLPSSEIEGT